MTNYYPTSDDFTMSFNEMNTPHCCFEESSATDIYDNHDMDVDLFAFDDDDEETYDGSLSDDMLMNDFVNSVLSPTPPACSTRLEQEPPYPTKVQVLTPPSSPRTKHSKASPSDDDELFATLSLLSPPYQSTSTKHRSNPALDNRVKEGIRKLKASMKQSEKTRTELLRQRKFLDDRHAFDISGFGNKRMRT